MKCFKCGCTLSEKDFCTNCRIDVALYKRIMYMSNQYYNDGLAKAAVRDLTGAITSLRQSLKFNKNNIEARNLLGLVYFERGQIAAALSEWVISKNFRPNKNIADDYISEVQSNASRLESINQTIKKYNKALEYCQQESYDLAVIQLKKVLSMHSRFFEGHLLLALLYMQSEEWSKAKKELLKCIKIDTNNTTALQYLREVGHKLPDDEPASVAVIKKRKMVAEDSIVYQSGNETIIQPANIKDTSIGSTILNIIIGIMIGMAACWFLVAQTSIRRAQAEQNEQIKQISDESDNKTAAIVELNQEIKDLQAGKLALEEQIELLSGSEGAQTAMDALMKAAAEYIDNTQDKEELQELLLSINEDFLEEEASGSYKKLYQSIMDAVGPEFARTLYQEGNLANNQNDYSKAIEALSKAWFFDNSDGQILYQLAQAYRMAEETAEAKRCYQEVIDLFPDTQNASKSQAYLDEM